MTSASVIFLLFTFFNLGLLQGTGSGNNGNLRLCIVEGRGTYKRAPKYCPILDEENSGVECVIGSDRLDCLRRISKGTVDFGVFSPEDLVAAQWADIDVLVTNEIRHRNRPFERNVVAVVNRRILPDSSSSLHAVLRNSTLCHPGVGAEDIRPLSDTLSGYLETLVLERSCDPTLSIAENRVKALASFFGKACKAGPWVVDKIRDDQLKQKYPSLCAVCGSSSKCSQSDRFWGDVGALACLGEGAGDVTWAELDDVVTYFGLNNSTRGSTFSSKERFAFLCRDGTWTPLTAEPCVWLNRPWNVIVAKRKASSAVTKLAESLTNSSVAVDSHWRGALAALLESPSALKQPLSPPPPPGDYLNKAKGFREAYSQSGCDPPRHITLCTTTLQEKNKCEWLSEAGAVYGISPPLQCVYKTDITECMKAVGGEIDVVVADSDWMVKGQRDYNITPILHEVTPIIEKTNTVVAFVNRNAKITKMADLRGKRAGFPHYDGFAWHAVKNYLVNKEMISCNDFSRYFSEICASGVSDCFEEGEEGALYALLEGRIDVAFISLATFKNFKVKPEKHSHLTDIENITPVCPEENKKYCFISWSSIGHVFASRNITAIRRHEIINVFESLDKMFGKHPPFHNPMFAMYGSFNHNLNVIFHNNTKSLTTDNVFKMHPYNMPLNFDTTLLSETECVGNFSGRLTPFLFVNLVAVLIRFVL